MVGGVGVGGCAGAGQSSFGAVGDGVQVLGEPKSIVDGVGVGGCAGSAHSSSLVVGGVVLVGGVFVKSLVVVVVVAVVVASY